MAISCGKAIPISTSHVIELSEDVTTESDAFVDELRTLLSRASRRLELVPSAFPCVLCAQGNQAERRC